MATTEATRTAIVVQVRERLETAAASGAIIDSKEVGIDEQRIRDHLDVPDKYVFARVTIGGSGSETLDLTAAPGLQSPIDCASLGLRAVRLFAGNSEDSSVVNAGSVTIDAAGSAGYELHRGRPVVLRPGEEAAWRDVAPPPITGATKAITFSGAEGDVVEFQAIASETAAVPLFAAVPASAGMRQVATGNIDQMDANERDYCTLLCAWSALCPSPYTWSTSVKYGTGGADPAVDAVNAAITALRAVNSYAAIIPYWNALEVRSLWQHEQQGYWPFRGPVLEDFAGSSISDPADITTASVDPDILIERYSYTATATSVRYAPNFRTPEGRAEFVRVVCEWLDTGPWSTLIECNGVHFDSFSGVDMRPAAFMGDPVGELNETDWYAMVATAGLLMPAFEARGKRLSLNVGGWGPHAVVGSPAEYANPDTVASINPTWAPSFWTDVLTMCHNYRIERVPSGGNITQNGAYHGRSKAALERTIDRLQELFAAGIWIEFLHGVQAQPQDWPEVRITTGGMLTAANTTDAAAPAVANGLATDEKVTLQLEANEGFTAYAQGISWNGGGFGAARLGTWQKQDYACWVAAGYTTFSLTRDQDQAADRVILFHYADDADDVETTVQSTDANFAWAKIDGGDTVAVASCGSNSVGGTLYLECNATAHGLYVGQTVTLSNVGGNGEVPDLVNGGTDSVPYNGTWDIIERTDDAFTLNVRYVDTPSPSSAQVDTLPEVVGHFDHYPVLQIALGLLACDSLADCFGSAVGTGNSSNPWQKATYLGLPQYNFMREVIDDAVGLGGPTGPAVIGDDDGDGYAGTCERPFANGTLYVNFRRGWIKVELD